MEYVGLAYWYIVSCVISWLVRRYYMWYVTIEKALIYSSDEPKGVSTIIKHVTSDFSIL